MRRTDSGHVYFMGENHNCGRKDCPAHDERAARRNIHNEMVLEEARDLADTKLEELNKWVRE